MNDTQSLQQYVSWLRFFNPHGETPVKRNSITPRTDPNTLTMHTCGLRMPSTGCMSDFADCRLATLTNDKRDPAMAGPKQPQPSAYITSSFWTVRHLHHPFFDFRPYLTTAHRTRSSLHRTQWRHFRSGCR